MLKLMKNCKDSVPTANLLDVLSNIDIYTPHLLLSSFSNIIKGILEQHDISAPGQENGKEECFH